MDLEQVEEVDLAIQQKKLRPSILKRFLALIVDFAILGAIGGFSSLFLEGFYIWLGSYGTLFGTVIVVLYFAILQSDKGKGQSVGKMAIDAKITDLNGNLMTFKQSLIRASLIYFPMMNAGLFSLTNFEIIIQILLGVLNFSFLYFMIVNKSRRGTQDLLTGSVVTYNDVKEFEVDQENDKSKNKIIGIAVIGGISCIGLIPLSSGDNIISDLRKAGGTIENFEAVNSVGNLSYSDLTSFDLDDGSFSSSKIIVGVRVNDKSLLEGDESNSELFDKIHEEIKLKVPESNDVDAILITLNYGYDIGIWSSSYSKSLSYEN